MEYEWIQIIIALIASVLIGFSKAGFPSAGIFVIVLMQVNILVQIVTNELRTKMHLIR
jgi:uncharacterized membrane protein YtjA (UPF0391 family)